jgi:exosortase
VAETNLSLLRQLPWSVLVILGGLWLLVINQLRIEWSINPQYAFGWSVPLLSLYLLWERWKNRPAPATGTRLNAGVTAALVILTFCVLPIRLVQESNPGWRLISWAFTLDLVGLSLGATYLLGGWAWVKHFSFPMCFFVVAVPWPTPLESLVIQTLARADATLTVEGLSWLGLPALQRGNVIEISTGLVGVDEACSGIRSFQATLMISLFLGECYRFDVKRRTILALAGSGLAFAFNVVRTLVLVRVAARDGISALHKWHDPAGVTILVACFCGLWLLAIFLRARNHTTGQDTLPAVPSLSTRILPTSVAVSLAIWFVMAEVFTQAWYQFHETKQESMPAWNLKWPADEASFTDQEVAETVRAQLRFGTGRSGRWTEPDGSVWQMFYFTWPRPESLYDRVILHNALSHRPEICLPASGLSLQADLGPRIFYVGSVALQFRRMTFESRGRPVHVFHCVWEEGRGSFAADQWLDWAVTSLWKTALIRIRAAIAGRRHNALRVLEIAVWGYPSAADAEAALQRELEKFVSN